MKNKSGLILFGGLVFVISGIVVFCASLANANSGSRIVDRGESAYKGIRAVCDDRTGNLVYQAEGIAGPIAVVPGGCAVPRLAQPGETTLSAPATTK